MTTFFRAVSTLKGSDRNVGVSKYLFDITDVGNFLTTVSNLKQWNRVTGIRIVPLPVSDPWQGLTEELETQAQKEREHQEYVEAMKRRQAEWDREEEEETILERFAELHKAAHKEG